MTQLQSTSTQGSSSSNALYDQLKLTAQLILPAIGALYFALSQIWNLPYGAEVTGTVAAANVFAGVAVAWLKSIHTAAGPTIDGSFEIRPNAEGGTDLAFKQIDLDALATKDLLVIKLDRK